MKKATAFLLAAVLVFTGTVSLAEEETLSADTVNEVEEGFYDSSETDVSENAGEYDEEGGEEAASETDYDDAEYDDEASWEDSDEEEQVIDYYDALEYQTEEDYEADEAEASDDTADVETAADWEATLPGDLTGIWGDDIVKVALSQLGYEESTRNFVLSDGGSAEVDPDTESGVSDSSASVKKGYTRYGAWYGSPYEDWCAMFASFCLYYAGVPTSVMPESSGTSAWVLELQNYGLYADTASGYQPVSGDLVFFSMTDENHQQVDHVGIVESTYTEYDENYNEYVSAIYTIEGNSGNAVRENYYDIYDARIKGYGVLPGQSGIDEESAEDWEASLPPLTGDTAYDVTAIAQSQIGYTESKRNFVLSWDSQLTKHGYSRYGAWYGSPYDEWDALFVSFCLAYADSSLPTSSTSSGLMAAAKEAGLLESSDYLPSAGDVVFFGAESGKTSAAVIERVDTEISESGEETAVALGVIEGDLGNAVRELTYSTYNVLGYAKIADESWDGYFDILHPERGGIAIAEIEGELGGTVTAEIPEGAFSEMVTLKAEAAVYTPDEMDPDMLAALFEAAEKTEDDNIYSLYVADIYFINGDGERTEPAKSVTITVDNSASPVDVNAGEADLKSMEKTIYHIDSMTGEVTAVGDVVGFDDDQQLTGMAFASEAFSPFVLFLSGDGIQTLAISGDAGISSFSVSAQVDGTEPWDADDEAGNDSNDSNNIVRTFDYVNYTLAYTTELTDPTVTVDSGNIYLEVTLPCGPEIASFNMNTLNWMQDPTVTYYLPDGTETTEYTNGMDVDKQVLTGYRELTNTSDNTAIPGTGTLSVGIYIGAAENGTTLKPEFTAWMDDNAEEDRVSIENAEELTISAAQKFNIGIRQASEMNISGTYDLSTGNENAARDTVSNNTSVRGRMEGYGVTVMMQNDSVDKGLKGLEFPSGEITFDLTLTEQANNRSGADLSSAEGYTPVMWDYDENLRKTVANGGSVGQWERTWVYTNANNRDCAYGAAPYNMLGCSTYSTIYDSCYDGGGWHIEQDTSNPLVYHVTIDDYTIDYENYNFPSANNTYYARSEPGTVYTANQACFSAGTIQTVLQFPTSAVDAPTYIYYKVAADNFAVAGTSYDVSAQYTGTYELVPEGSIQSGTNFTDDTATSRAQSGHQLGSSYTAGDAYSFIGSNIRLWGYMSTTTDEYVRTNATLIKFDADAFEINRDDEYYASGRYSHGSGEGKVNSFTRYFAGRSSNWGSTQEMSDTLINSTDLTYFSSLEALESAGLICVGVLYIADVEDINSSSQCQGMIGLTVKDDAALIGNVYAACNDAWASYSTLEELEEKYGTPVTDGGTINTDWARNGHDLYKAYCSLSVYETMKDTIESGNNGDYWYHKTEYDEDGNITGGHDVGYYGGTSLLICGEKATVEISTDKTVYDMDSGQRTTVVTVTPSVTVDGNASSETGDKGTTTTTATVKVTLPASLTYDPGSAYWGDTAITPTVTVNDDGTTVLTFTLSNVTLGETLDALTFSCTIGHAGYSDDVNNNDSVSLNATIESTNDHRAKEEAYGNSSNTSFNIIRLSATSISKSVDERLIERNGSFTWTLNFYNGASDEIGGTEMADVFPVSGDAYGSSFAGTYSITGIEVDFTDAPESFEKDQGSMHFYVSSDYSGTGSELANGDAPTDWTDLMTAASEKDAVFTLSTSGSEDMKAFYCDLGDLEPGETIVVRISVQTEGNDPGDLYSNLYYEAATDQDTAVQSNLVTTQVVQRNITGRSWYDANHDGMQDSSEAAFATTVSLFAEQEISPAGLKLFATESPAIDVYGNTVEPVKTADDGSYSFENLPAGTYRIEFSDVNGYIYELTLENAGSDDSIDSDASPVSNEDGDLIAEITDVELPEIEDMDRYLYEENYNDAGYYAELISLEGSKIWDDEDDKDGIRPDSVTVHLLADGEEIDSQTVAADEDGNWTFSFTDLEPCNEDGSEIVYTIEEDAVDGYTADVSEIEWQDEGVYAVTITNSHTPETETETEPKTEPESESETHSETEPQSESEPKSGTGTRHDGGNNGGTTGGGGSDGGTEGSSGGVKTGDDTPIALYLSLMLAALAVLGSGLYFRRRRSR